MQALPTDKWRAHACDGFVLVAAHEHNGWLWWTKVPIEPSRTRENAEHVELPYPRPVQ